MNAKKLLSIVLALSMVLLCACTGTNSQTGQMRLPRRGNVCNDPAAPADTATTAASTPKATRSSRKDRPVRRQCVRDVTSWTMTHGFLSGI